MPVASKLVTAATSNARAATIPLSGPSQLLSRHGQPELVASALAALLKDILKIVQATQAVPPPPPEVEVIEGQKQPKIKASKVEFKLVNEMYAPRN
jgi:hypothetical protein